MLFANHIYPIPLPGSEHHCPGRTTSFEVGPALSTAIHPTDLNITTPDHALLP